jgi:hypothetical protein
VLVKARHLVLANLRAFFTLRLAFTGAQGVPLSSKYRVGEDEVARFRVHGGIHMVPFFLMSKDKGWSKGREWEGGYKV